MSLASKRPVTLFKNEIEFPTKVQPANNSLAHTNSWLLARDEFLSF